MSIRIGRAVAGAAQPAADGEAVERRHQHVEDDELRCVPLHERGAPRRRPPRASTS